MNDTTKILMYSQEKGSLYMIRTSFKIFDNLIQAKAFVKKHYGKIMKKEYDFFYKEIGYIQDTETQSVSEYPSSNHHTFGRSDKESD